MIALEKGEHMNIYHIGTMEEIPIEKVAEEVGKYFGKKIEIMPERPAEGGTLRRCPDTGKLGKLGYRPRVPFREGLKITAEWYDKNSDKIKKINR